MKPQPNPDSSPRPPAAANPAGPATIPLTVYRELSAELQATKAMLDSLNQQNQQLTRQNQQFRHEIERLMQVSINLQQIAGLPQTGWNRSPEALPSAIPTHEDAVPVQLRPKPIPRATPSEAPLLDTGTSVDELYETEEVPVQRPSAKPQSSRDMTGLWLWVTVFVIIITAFGAGFMVVKPLLPKR